MAIPVRKLVVRYVQGEGPVAAGGIVVKKKEDAVKMLRQILAEEPREVFGMLMLASDGTLLGYHEVHRGTLNQVNADPRDIFQAALLVNAESIVVCHNHPSGNATASPQDKGVPPRLITAGVLMGIRVLDHIILGADDTYTSMRELGFVEPIEKQCMEALMAASVQ